MKDSEQKRIRDDERRIVAALRSGATISNLTAEETVTRVKLLMAQGRLVFEKVSPRAHEALFSNRALRNRFLALEVRVRRLHHVNRYPPVSRVDA